VAIDQHTEAVATEQKPGWFPINSRPRLPVSGGRDAINMLGAVTDTGERFVALTPDTFNAEVSTLFGRLAELAEYVDGDAIHETVDRCPSKVQGPEEAVGASGLLQALLGEAAELRQPRLE